MDNLPPSRNAPTVDCPAIEQNADAVPALSEEDVALFCRAIGVAPRRMGRGARDVIARHDIGQRGVWIMALVSAGVDSPSRLSDVLCISRSLFTAELGRLSAAGLVVTEKDVSDGRRLKLQLTEKGAAASRQLQKTINIFVNETLAGFSRADVLKCARLLLAFAGADADRLGPDADG